MATLAENLKYFEAVRDTAGRLIEGWDFPSGPRLNVVIAYISVLLEHQRAIYELVRLRLYGSAFALLRPLLETGLRSLWVLRFASDEQVEAVGQRGESPFPKFELMCQEVDAGFATEGVFADFGRAWGPMCGFTHSGLEQLGRRFNGKDVTPNYSSEEVSGLVGLAASVVLATLNLYFTHCGFLDKARELECAFDEHN